MGKETIYKESAGNCFRHFTRCLYRGPRYIAGEVVTSTCRLGNGCTEEVTCEGSMREWMCCERWRCDYRQSLQTTWHIQGMQRVWCGWSTRCETGMQRALKKARERGRGQAVQKAWRPCWGLRTLGHSYCSRRVKWSDLHFFKSALTSGQSWSQKQGPSN